MSTNEGEKVEEGAILFNSIDQSSNFQRRNENERSDAGEHIVTAR